MSTPTRVEVWRWIFVRSAVKCGEKNIIFTAYFLHLFAVNAVNRRELFIFTAHSYKKESSPHGFEPQTSCRPSTAYSTAPTVNYIFEISCEFKSDWVNFGNLMRWIFVRNAVNFAVIFCKKCGEMRWNNFFYGIHRNHRISYKNSPKNLDPGNGICPILTPIFNRFFT